MVKMQSQETQQEAVNLQKIALIIEYNGSHFHGFARQKVAVNVQSELERVLSKIANHEVITFCAGRTDTGVHACAQVIHFETSAKRDLKAWVHGVNSIISPHIKVKQAFIMPTDFHARFSAIARTYRYIIYCSDTRSAIFNDMLTHHIGTLDIAKMQQAADCLQGEHDFSSFRSSQCQANTPNRFVEYTKVSQLGSYVIIEIKANAFLHHMVRNIVGNLIEIGSGKRPIGFMRQLLDLKDRSKGAATSPANGLYFIAAHYPTRYNLPILKQAPLWLNFEPC